MECPEFRSRLTRYLEGALDATEFDRMVRHEAGCAACRRLAAEGMPDAAPDLAHPQDAALIAEILRRTLGADCRQIELRLAAEIDGALPATESERVRQHLAECADCRALALALRRLPEAYRLLPRLHAGAAFTRAVLRRTLPARPGFLSVLGRMWQGSALMWEGALVCSLLLTPILGRPAQESASRLSHELRQARLGLSLNVSAADSWRELRTDLSSAGSRTEAWIAELSARVHRQLVLVWGATTRTRPEAEAGKSDEGGTDELRKP